MTLADGKLTIKGVQLDIAKAIKRVRLDLKDDWFQDPFKYEDILNIDYISTKLSKYHLKNELYKAGRAIHIDIPKPGFSIRYSSETDIVDRIMYQAVIDFIAEDLDKLHSNHIYSHRINYDRNNEKYFFRYAVEEWRKFIADTGLELDADNRILLLTDLTTFYENIGIKDLTNVLELFTQQTEKKEAFKVCVELLKNMLESWCELNTRRGIPQNRDASAFIANIFLHPVDDAMQKHGFKYFRYMDDIRIVCKDKFEARRALKCLIHELRRKGLNVNSKKTRILDSDNSKDKIDINESLKKTDKKIEQIDEHLKAKKARDLQIAVPMLRDKIQGLIDNNNTLDREFRYCVNRLERISRNESLAQKIDFTPITDRIIKEVIDQPWSTDTFARYLGSVKLSKENLEYIRDFVIDEKRNIYEWQSFYLWIILVRNKISNPDLVKDARKNISNSGNVPIVAASCLYLGALGDQNDRKFVAENFSKFSNHLTQRFALIAIKDLSFDQIIKPHVQPYVMECYTGSYKLLKEKFSEQFLMPIEPLDDDNIYEDLPDDIS